MFLVCGCGPKDPCVGVDCSGVGWCQALPYDLGGYCVCEAGYHPAGGGMECAANDAANPCTGVDCGGHGYCGNAAGAGGPLCVCFPGWHIDESGLWCLPDGAPGDGGSGPDEGDGVTGDGDTGGVFWRDELVWEPALDRVDILVLRGRVSPMSSSEMNITRWFPDLIEELVNPSDADGDGLPDHPAVEDINVGVISDDMGTMGFRVSTCSESDRGDDGCMLHAPSPAVLDCAESYPTFLSRNPTNAATYGVEELGHDFTCIGTLGTDSCGFEQQLKAVDKALVDNSGAGRCNEGFLRPDSTLVVIVQSEEEDCSVDPAHPEMFDSTRDDLGHLNIRCFLHPEFVIPVGDYLGSLGRLLPGRPGGVVLGLIVGVPPDAPECIGSGAGLEACLGVSSMQERIDPEDPTTTVPSCNTSMGQAFPPRRFVRLAIDLANAGGKVYVDSVCKYDWSEAVRGITDEIVDGLTDDTVCVEPFPFDPATCMTGCYLFETLNTGRACEADPGCPQEWCPEASPESLDVLRPCRDPATGEACTPLLRDLGTEGAAGFERRRCLVRQAPRNPFAEHCGDYLAPLAGGWYYLPGEWYGGCDNLRFYHPGTEELIDPESSFATLRCWR